MRQTYCPLPTTVDPKDHARALDGVGEERGTSRTFLRDEMPPPRASAFQSSYPFSFLALRTSSTFAL